MSSTPPGPGRSPAGPGRSVGTGPWPPAGGPALVGAGKEDRAGGAPLQQPREQMGGAGGPVHPLKTMTARRASRSRSPRSRARISPGAGGGLIEHAPQGLLPQRHVPVYGITVSYHVDRLRRTTPPSRSPDRDASSPTAALDTLVAWREWLTVAPAGLRPQRAAAPHWPSQVDLRWSGDAGNPPIPSVPDYVRLPEVASAPLCRRCGCSMTPQNLLSGVIPWAARAWSRRSSSRRARISRIRPSRSVTCR